LDKALSVLSPEALVGAIELLQKRGIEGDPTYERFFAARLVLSKAAWDGFAAAIGGPEMATGIAQFPLSADWVRALLQAFDRTPPITMRREDFAEGYVWTYDLRSVANLNRVNQFRAATAELMALVGKFLAEHSTEIEEVCGHSWRVASVRAFAPRPYAAGGRHKDGWPLKMKKLFLLPAGATPQTGSTWFRLRTGEEIIIDHPDPLWMIFENSVLEHSVVTPRGGRRPTIEIDLLPAAQTDPTPVDAGVNGWYPWFPSRASLIDGTKGAYDLACRPSFIRGIRMAMVGSPPALAIRRKRRALMAERIMKEIQNPERPS